MAKKTSKRSSRKPSTPARPAVVPIAVRLPVEVWRKLIAAMADRKIARTEPWQQQQIVTEALAAWLKREGY